MCAVLVVAAGLEGQLAGAARAAAGALHLVALWEEVDRDRQQINKTNDQFISVAY